MYLVIIGSLRMENEVFIVTFEYRNTRHQFETKSFETAQQVATIIHDRPQRYKVRIQQGHQVWNVRECVRSGVWEPER